MGIHGSIEVTTRGCAKQGYAYQHYTKERGWTTVHKINESVYSEGCLYPTVGLRFKRHKTKYCFCSDQRAESFDRFEAGNGLIMNASKTQLMLGGKVQRTDLEDFHAVVDRVTVFPDKKLELLGVKFD
eukprot:snap_masked-scaffold471_size162517-processed-gene-0.9 protein:Tk09931 transcript:snap_masked-scaffold471_size162517-processed-gene-0.9-mRNA-1 annotation:"hypothetical protein DAPPUDRAFT_303551"